MHRPMFVVQIVSSTLIICLTAFIATISVTKDMSIFVKYLTEMIAAFAQLLYWCWAGNKVYAEVIPLQLIIFKIEILTEVNVIFGGFFIVFQSPDVAQAMYFCDWYKMNMKFKIATFHIIRRAQKPIRYHAGALFHIDFVTFITVCQMFSDKFYIIILKFAIISYILHF